MLTDEGVSVRLSLTVSPSSHILALCLHIVHQLRLERSSVPGKSRPVWSVDDRETTESRSSPLSKKNYVRGGIFGTYARTIDCRLLRLTV